MALNELPPPDVLRRAFLEGLGADDSLRLEFSLPVFTLSLTDLTKPAGPVRAKAIGWQFLTLNAQRGVVIGEVANEPDDPNGEIETSLTRGTIINLVWQAYGEIKEHPELLNEPFDVRRLRISPLRIDAFWLKAPPADNILGPGDRVYPFVAFQPQLKFNLLPAPDFLDIVRKLAAKAISQKAPIRKRR